MQYINVVIDNKSESTDNYFTYRAPESVRVGDTVRVAFNMRKKPLTAYVFQVGVTPSLAESRIRDIDSVDEQRSLSAEMIDTALWMRKRYGVKYIDAVKMFTVGGKRVSEKILKTSDSPEEEHELTEEQRRATAEINASLDEEKQKVFLLKGVTGSGKTEVYMQAAKHALDQGKSVIILVPEIALSVQMERRFQKRFGEDNVATLHSKLTTSKRLENWLRIRQGRAKVVVGARTAVFAPVENLGLVVIDEEHETTYKSDHNPKYETLDVAYKRAEYYGATVVLGSATPSVVSYYRASVGLYRLLELHDRVGGGKLPAVQIEDLRGQLIRGRNELISPQLEGEMRQCLQENHQVILFLNRRGYAPQIQCMKCGQRLMCEDCGIALTYHKRENAAICHYCGKKLPPPKTCPKCGSEYLRFGGAGTEKVEELVQDLFTEYRVARFDLDTAKNQKEIDRTISDFIHQRTHILIGTQILAKGLDFRNVGLVGIINADVSLNIPDYRAAERSFQLITQVSGRAGRASEESRVVIQTFNPEEDVIRYAATGDYQRFYESELLHRKIMNYPPYTDLIAISFSESDKYKERDPSGMDYALDFKGKLESMKNAPAGAVIYCPREETFKGMSDRRRVTFLIKAPKGSRTGYVQAYMNYREWMIQQKSTMYIEIDVNPYGIV